MRRRVGQREATATLLLTLLLAVAGCGSGSEQHFSAQDFIDEANSHDAGLTLGEKLFSGKEDVETYGVSLEGEGADAPGAGSAAAESGASLTISPDSHGAIEVYRQCEQTGTFVCFRAANASLAFESIAKQADLDRLTTAIREMASK